MDNRSDEERANASENRLFIGNYDLNFTEYIIVRLFEVFGKVKKLDFLYHKHGPRKGEPRGFCFLEFETPEAAAKAIKNMNGRIVNGRALVVSRSLENKWEEAGLSSKAYHHRPVMHEPVNPRLQAKPMNVDAKIQALERKLAKLNKREEPASGGPSRTTSSTGSKAGNRYHPYSKER
ncbi:hypothetical protein BJ742DRAFT_229704 [Cladochytrium replicatum]|nr:hypothetical protein BJ742DRAFT_229704 [Cladochytrium replicatum]